MRKDKTDRLDTLDIGRPIPCICIAYIGGCMNLCCPSAFVCFLLVYHPKLVFGLIRFVSFFYFSSTTIPWRFSVYSTYG
jgi:hypothetical protein